MTAERAVARIDLDAVERNCRHLAAELTADAELCAVVKADGYGHGADACAAAALEGGATRLAVATAREAEQTGRRLQHVPLLTMGALTATDVDVALAAGSEVAAGREEALRLIAARAGAQGRPAKVHVKYDSGMGRLGATDPEEVMALVAICEAEHDLRLAGIWTHFATADEIGDDYFDQQLARFTPLAQELKARHPEITVHAANSAAVYRDPAAHFDMARCGIAIYGLDPFQEDPAARGLEPALELHSYVADVKRFGAGSSAGYGRTWKASQDTWVGVLPIGYGDGVRRGLSNNAEVLVRGRRHPLVGTVSMDNVTIDLGPETDVSPGDEAVLIGAQGEERILAEEVAGRLGTINYEVTCGISARVPRVPAEPG
ncbi:MAG: alanine racemase [Actinomycetota bacterium]